ncbi:MAG: tetratricopeptide repeat protein [Chitinophagaceae bacterium]|nr:MAG: tetratricopeptide repeat protein [Chitinophagaceae bacterium]
MKLLLLISFFFLSFHVVRSQEPAAIDSIKKVLAKAKTPAEKIDNLVSLTRLLMNVNITEADSYGKQMMEIAELSRDRRLIFRGMMANGERYSYLSGSKDNVKKSVDYFQQALELAKQNRLDSQTFSAQLALGNVYLYVPDLQKADLAMAQAQSLASQLKSDSMMARVNIQYGVYYIQKNEKIMSLRNFLDGLRIAEDLDNPSLMRLAYSRLSFFYDQVEDYDRAIDYADKSLKQLDRILTGASPYNRVQEYNNLGRLYGRKKNFDISMTYYDRALKLADSLKFEPMKAMMYQSIVNDYMSANQPQKALDYFNSHPQMLTFLKSVNFEYLIDQSYGFMYARLEKYDSALHYYKRMAPFADRMNAFNGFGYYGDMGVIYRQLGNYALSEEFLLKARDLAASTGNLTYMSSAAEELDTLYRDKGDFKQALFYNNLSHTYKDSLQSLSKEKDMLQLEISDEQQRQARLEREALEHKRKRDNIQYLAITLGITGLFLLLVMLGMFRVSARTIKMIGFFAFLMFFEFIFLIFKKNIYSLTKGEPWRDLLFMICLAAILLPLHHWLEHKVIHYLTSHNRLTQSGRSFREKWLRRNKPPEPNNP